MRCTFPVDRNIPCLHLSTLQNQIWHSYPSCNVSDAFIYSNSAPPSTQLVFVADLNDVSTNHLNSYKSWAWTAIMTRRPVFFISHHFVISCSMSSQPFSVIWWSNSDILWPVVMVMRNQNRIIKTQRQTNGRTGWIHYIPLNFAAVAYYRNHLGLLPWVMAMIQWIIYTLLQYIIKAGNIFPIESWWNIWYQLLLWWMRFCYFIPQGLFWVKHPNWST